jgi:hypothetical protein
MTLGAIEDTEITEKCIGNFCAEASAVEFPFSSSLCFFAAFVSGESWFSLFDL